MAEHYFTGEPTSRHEARTVCVQAGGRALAFETDAGTFSKTRLDPGSRLLLEALPPLSGRCADIGCGWGAIGVSLAAQNPDLFVEMVDVNERAVGLARRNAEANGVYNARALVSEPDLLVLDDLGAERSTEYAIEQLYAIVDQRYRSGKPLIVTTNMTLEQLKNGPELGRRRIYERVLEMCPYRCQFTGPNRRTKMEEDEKNG